MNASESFVIQIKDEVVGDESWLSLSGFDDLETCQHYLDVVKEADPDGEYRMEHVVTVRTVIG